MSHAYNLAIKEWEWVKDNPVKNVRGIASLYPEVIQIVTLKSSGIKRYLLSMLETVQMALLALILSVSIAFPLAFAASRTTR